MRKDGKIYITISDERGKNIGGISSTGQNGSAKKIITTKEDTANSLLNSYAMHELFTFTKQQVSKAVNYSLSNIGNFTGDYATQRKVNAGLEAVGTAAGIGLATWQGFKRGGVKGALIGFAIGTLATGISSALQNKSQINENDRANYQIEQLRERAGLKTLKDGSRGTEN